MIQHTIAAALLLVSCTALDYPRYEMVFRDPRTYDVLYSSAAGPVNETLRFSRRVNLTGLILPTQIVNYWQTVNGTVGSAGVWTATEYEEELEVRLYERTSLAPAGRLVGAGHFRGVAPPRHELRVRLDATDASDAEGGPAPPTVRPYDASSAGAGGDFQYTASVAFRKAGLYPWYLRRDVDVLSPLQGVGSPQGLVIGLTFVLA